MIVPSPPPALNVQTPGAVARFAAHVYGLFYGCALRLTAFSGARLYDFAFLSLQSRMGGRSEIAHDLFVTGGTFLETRRTPHRECWAERELFGWSYCRRAKSPRALQLPRHPTTRFRVYHGSIGLASNPTRIASMRTNKKR